MFHVKHRTEGEEMTSTATPAVEIPADVKDNNTHSVRVQWRNTRDARPDEIESGIRYLDTFEYTLHTWDDTDREGTRVTLHRFVNRHGQTVDLYATYYFTRIGCTDCQHSYAVQYIEVTDHDGNTSGPHPYCDFHADMVRKWNRDLPGYTVAESEPLVIGQHD